MKRIHEIKTVCGILDPFIEQHKGILDEKTKADFKAVVARVDAEVYAGAKARDQIAIARTSRDLAYEDVQSNILETKKCIEMVVIRDKKGVLVPELGDLIYNPARINILAGRFLMAAGRAGNDPVLVKAAAKLRSSLETYVTLYNQTYDRVSARTQEVKTTDEKVVTLAGEVKAYRTLIAYRSSPELRRELNNRLKAAFPRNGRKNGANAKAPTVDTELRRDGVTSTAETTTATQPTAFPALPTIPGLTTASDGNKVPPSVLRDVAVPQTGDHPQLSANA